MSGVKLVGSLGKIVLRKVSSIMVGYILATVSVAVGLFWLIVEAQAREDEANEREMLMRRDWDLP